MSSILLLKEFEGNKKGDIISVPFIRRKELLVAGIGIDPPIKGAVPKPMADPEIDRLRKQNAELQKQIDELLAAEKPVEKLHQPLLPAGKK